MSKLEDFKGDMLLEQAINEIAKQYDVDARVLSEMVNIDLNKSIELLQEG